MMFYTSFIERAEQASHVVPNENKGYIAKDLTFLRKLDMLLKDPESSRESIPAAKPRNLQHAFLLTVRSPRYRQIRAPPFCSSLSIVPSTVEPVPSNSNIPDAGLKHNRHGKLFGRRLFGQLIKTWLLCGIQGKN